MGGIAALVNATAYVVGFIVMLTVLDPGDAPNLAPGQKLAFVLDRMALFQTWNLFIYVLFGAALVPLVIALHARAGADSAITSSASAFGLIWAGMVIAAGMIVHVGLSTVAAIHATDPAQAVTLWRTVCAIQDGLGAVFGLGQIAWFGWLSLVMTGAHGRPAYP